MQLLTLGGLRLDRSDFTRPKPLLLLTYLAVEGAQSRRVLAELFFGDTKDPRDSLSTALRHFRSFGDEAFTEEDDRLLTRLPCDAVDLMKALDSGLLEPAIDKYGGPFLAGFDLELGEEIEEWIYSTREHVAGRVREAHVRLGEARLANADATRAARYAEESLGVVGAPPLEPELFSRLHRLLKAGSSPRVAEVEQAAREFGIELVSAYGAADAPIRPLTVVPNNLPPSGTSFVGRDADRMRVAKFLAEPHGRLLTIHGPGGIGKSRLALQAAHDQVLERRFVDGVHLAPLEALSTTDQALEAIAASADVDLEGSSGPLAQLASIFGTTRRLLILDGFEPILDASEALACLLQACPNLKIVVTSRKRLELAQEHVLTLEGLSPPRENASLEEALSSDALRLIVQRGKKARLEFELDEASLDEAIRLCELVEGSPLGIELAMGWARVMTIGEIRREIEKDVDFLVTTDRSGSKERLSLKSVFERSWKLLGRREQDVLPALGVFHGGFRREAAAEVAGANLSILMNLVDASLLKMSNDGRYRLHSVVREYCLKMLATAPENQKRVLDAHASYYRAHGDEHLSSMYSANEVEALGAIGAELQNIVAAWKHLLRGGFSPGDRFPNQLVVFFDRLGLFRDGIRFFRDAANEVDPADPTSASIRSEIVANEAWLQYRSGTLDIALDLANEILAMDGASSLSVMMALNLRGLVLMDIGGIDEGVISLTKAIGIAKEHHTLNRAAMYLINLSTGKWYSGDSEGARCDLEEAIGIAEEQQYPFLLVAATNNLAGILEEEGHVTAALDHYARAIEVAEECNFARMLPALLANSAEACLSIGNVRHAIRLLRDAEAGLAKLQDNALDAQIHHLQGQIQFEERDLEEAEASLRRAFDLSVQHVRDWRYVKVMVSLAEVWIQQDRPEDAWALLVTLRSKASHLTSTHEHIERLLGEIPDRARVPSHREASFRLLARVERNEMRALEGQPPR